MTHCGMCGKDISDGKFRSWSVKEIAQGIMARSPVSESIGYIPVCFECDAEAIEQERMTWVPNHSE